MKYIWLGCFGSLSLRIDVVVLSAIERHTLLYTVAYKYDPANKQNQKKRNIDSCEGEICKANNNEMRKSTFTACELNEWKKCDAEALRRMESVHAACVP